MANQWGNPELKSFKNNYIRRVIVDLARVFVHKNIAADVEELLIRAASYGANFSEDKLPAILPAYDFDDTLESRYGIKFQIPNFTRQIDLTDLPFEQIGDVFIYKDFDLDVVPDTEMPNFIDEQTDKIGSHLVKLGSQGKDVKFLAYFFGVADASQKNTFDKELQDAATFFQNRMGMPETGEVDAYTWGAIIPKGHERIAAGYAGIKVRALQSALIVNGYYPPITSRFGTETIRTVREFQSDHNLRITGRVGFLEWDTLFALR